ncbi:FHAD1 protein, partial [Corvus moneduloides]|nr:FHAD1 protein [Corvus moneduloides]
RRAFPKSSGCFQLKSYTATIGSHRGADIVLQSAGVADRHAALEFSASDNSFVLQDFNSPHGTFVNSCQVQNAAVRVRPGVILSFGTAGASFELVLDGAAQVGWGCPGKGGWGCPGKVPGQGWVRSAAQGKVPREGGWVDAAARGSLQKQELP